MMKLATNLDSGEVDVDGQKIHLTRTELSIFVYLLHNQDSVCTVDAILEEALGYAESVRSRIVSTYISFLRKKFKGTFLEGKIYTKNGYGFRIIL